MPTRETRAQASHIAETIRSAHLADLRCRRHGGEAPIDCGLHQVRGQERENFGRAIGFFRIAGAQFFSFGC